jgi:long-subunit acyl-CoA synthetase (AMP-forming)
MSGSPETLVAAFRATVARRPQAIALRTKGGADTLTWTQYAQCAEAVARGLAGLGVERGRTVALLLGNRAEFHVCDVAALLLGATPFSVYNTMQAEQICHLLRDSATSVVITEQRRLDAVRIAAREAGVEYVVAVDGNGPADVMTLAELMDAGDAAFDLHVAERAVGPEDVATIIYTSGTTGPPKGVELTHANVLATLHAYGEVVEFPDEGRVVSWLPMAHIAERACSHYLPILRGYTTTCCPDPREVVAHLPDVRPTWFFAVPRTWEKLRDAIEAGADGATRAAIDAGLRRTRAIQAGQPVPAALERQYRVADETILSKLRAALGLDHARSVNVGAAPCPCDVIEFFHAIGVMVAELYGMSETCGAGAVNPRGRIRIGTVGPPLPGVDLRLADDGEILLRGPMVMAGYRNAPAQTREALDGDGWLRTGDIGALDDQGYLRIIDRKKDLIINAAGKNMSPANIEAAVKSASPLISNVVAIGDRRPYNVALITLDPEAVARFGSDIAQAVRAAVDEGNAKLARVEQIKKFKVLDSEWHPGGDEMTPTSKLKRKAIAEKYADQIAALYEEDATS